MNRRECIRMLGATAVVLRPEAGRPWDQPQSATSNDRFDFIVVGAGAAGCVLANRLTARPSVRVLLLEAGVEAGGDAAVADPGRWASLMGSRFDWAYTTEPEAGLQDRRIPFPRGKALGGSSAIGAMAFVRGHRMSYDRWRDLGNDGWGYDDLVPIFKRSERHEAGPSASRGGDGPLNVAYCWDPHAAHRAFLAAAVQNGFRADARFDFNGGSISNAAGFFQKTILDGRRHSAAAAFLGQALSRPNLDVRPGAQALKLVVDGHRVVGVDFVQNRQRTRALAAREVVLCSGVIESPKLLMLSGIGPADHLRRHGIAVVADLPGVGQNLQDHLQVTVRWASKAPLPPSTVTAGFFTRSSPGAESMQRAPDVQLTLGLGTDAPDSVITITSALVQPQSRGEVRLRSADPTTAPIVRANYLQSDADVDALVRGVRLARWFGEAEAFDALRADEVEPGPSITSDSDLAVLVRRTAGTAYGAAGTCRMGPAGDPTAVVDDALRVRGVDGVRVADGSVMPEVVGVPTQAACMVIGEKAAELLGMAY